jgi:PIN domain nuclease of toxin-antitoxin system
MRVGADSHALVWFTQAAPQLSSRAGGVLREAEASDGPVISVATLVDLWYITQSTAQVTVGELAELRGLVTASPAIELHPIDITIVDAYTTIGREALRDPWDRFIVATAVALRLPLVTRDGAIHDSGHVAAIW